MSGMWRTVGSLLISVFAAGWLMLEAVETLFVRGKDLVTDCALLTDWDLEKIKFMYYLLSIALVTDFVQDFLLSFFLKTIMKQFGVRDIEVGTFNSI